MEFIGGFFCGFVATALFAMHVYYDVRTRRKAKHLVGRVAEIIMGVCEAIYDFFHYTSVGKVLMFTLSFPVRVLAWCAGIIFVCGFPVLLILNILSVFGIKL